MAELFAGTSGYSYPSWKPDFYPQKLAAKMHGSISAEMNQNLRANRIICLP